MKLEELLKEEENNVSKANAAVAKALKDEGLDPSDVDMCDDEYEEQWTYEFNGEDDAKANAAFEKAEAALAKVGISAQAEASAPPYLKVYFSE